LLKKIKKIIKNKFTKNYWKSDISSAWHNRRKIEAYDDFNFFAQAICEKIEDLNFDTVIEVGTGAGTLITLLSEKLDKYNKFIGVDINKNQIIENRKNYKDLYNVEFVYMEVEKYIKSNNLNNAVIVSQNTFDYFKKNELEKLFSLIYSNIKHVAILVSTVKEYRNIQDSIENVESDFKVYKHNYYSLLQSTGYEFISADVYSNDYNMIVVGIKQ
jgi:cyclopropane fatty-acyl-phospholipid synthase-like methyltransferase